MVEASTADAKSTERGARNIVLAIDASTDSEYAVQWCIANMHRQGDALYLLHCVPSTTSHVPMATAMGHLHYVHVPEIDSNAVAAAKQRVDNLFGSKLAAASVPYEVKVVVDAYGHAVHGGGVGEKICSAASELNAAAVVVAAHRKSPFAEFMMGSVSNYLVHRCTRPVLVLHAPRSAESDGHLEAIGTRNIALAVGSTHNAAKVCSWALQHLVRRGDLLHVLHVVPAQPEAVGAYSVFGSLALEGMAYMPAPTKEQVAVAAAHREAVRADLKSRLQDLVANSEASGLTVHIVRAGVNNPMESVGGAICKKCASLNAAALVTLSGHKGPLRELFMGSVTSYCTHHCESPVLVLT